MYRRNLITVILVSVVLAGCSDTDTLATVIPGGSAGGDVSNLAMIDGTWKTGCRNAGDISSTHEFVALNGNMQSDFTFFDDANCTVLSSVVSETSTYTIGDSVVVNGTAEGITSANKMNNVGGSSSAFDIVAITSNGNTMYFGDFFTGNGDADATRPTQLSLEPTDIYTNQSGNTGTGGGAVVDTTVSAKYEGTYLEACAAEDDDDAETEFEIRTTSTEGTTSTVTLQSFTDVACTVPTETAVIVFVNSHVYSGGTVQTTQGLADFVDTTTETMTVNGQPLTAEQLQEATADGEFNTDFDIVLLVGTALFKGENTDTLDGESAANRPTTLETDSSVRQ
jgi:hypothetical protein